MLTSGCADIFRVGKDVGSVGDALNLHYHQEEAIRRARTGASYVLTTGTGSGKSLSYIIPIVDYCLRNGPHNKRTKAIIVYPMNALANSQMGELEKFLNPGRDPSVAPVSYARYTGQESDEEKEAIQRNPPDILLTNYVMMELILTRNEERNLIDAAQNLRFLVLDELHTYRGRQGADVALLVRRIREELRATNFQAVGTSATLASVSTFAEMQKEVARMASDIFGQTIPPENIIGETLRRYTEELDFGQQEALAKLREAVRDGLDDAVRANPEAFRLHPLASWIESQVGLTTETGSGRKRRAQPLPLRGVPGDNSLAARLESLTGHSINRCELAIREVLLAGYALRDPVSRLPIFAFRLHQFLSRGDTVYATLATGTERYLTLSPQVYRPGGAGKERLLPLEFCRECGQEYYRVSALFDRLNKDGRPLASSQCQAILPRDTDPAADENRRDVPGYLLLTDDPEVSWPESPDTVLERVPEDWLEYVNGQPARVVAGRRDWLPRRMAVRADGTVNEDGGRVAWFMAQPFRFCPCCGVSYDARQRSDKAKLGTLGIDRRSTATTILTLSAVRALRDQPLEALAPVARKVLSFTDNRQDASLQSGHFNDFIEVGLLRGALYAAADQAGPAGLLHDVLAQRVYEALSLPFADFAQKPEAKFAEKANTIRAFQNVLGYRLYRDLRRGWRIVAPNLEQCGLLEIRYQSLDELCAADEEWRDAGNAVGQKIDLHPSLKDADTEIRFRICTALLDYLRRELAIKVPYLDGSFQESIRQQSNQHLVPPWAIDEDDTRLDQATIAFPRARRGNGNDYEGHLYLSARGGFGTFLKRRSTLPHLPAAPKPAELEAIIPQLFLVLAKAGLVQPVHTPEDPKDIPGYQIPASALIFLAGDGTRAFHDPLRMPNAPVEGNSTNAFFVRYYREEALKTKGIEAREHTAQVPYEAREQREKDFAAARLPILFCSPTMELGVDIRLLNVVNLRNVPPTPANYAQRSGRAGRSGQPALVFTYCSGTSQHDQWFFKRPEQMVYGAVSTPRLDLGNEDLIRAHIQAIWLGETGTRLGRSLRDVLDVEGESPSLAVIPSTLTSLSSPHAREAARLKARSILSTVRDLTSCPWFYDGWIDSILNQVLPEFEKACERWRTLFRSAHRQMDRQNKVRKDASASQRDKDEARRLYAEAESQLKLLTEAKNATQSDFYSYRYLASEGFLPGYSFPRLPLSAYIPGRKRVSGSDEFLSRPRFLGISEFGPHALVYHEGARYRIHKVIMPVRDDATSTTLRRAKLCSACGHLHPVDDRTPVDKCVQCGHIFGRSDHELPNLFRLENVSTRRVDRISSDEEERLRQGFELRTAIRWAESRGTPVFRRGIARLGDETTLALTYGHAATVWRINYGLNRRENKEDRGFWLDVERGYWVRTPNDADDSAPDRNTPDPAGAKREKVIPFVEDRKNCLLVELSPPPADPRVLPSLQAALKHAIQVVYNLEDMELAADPLPDRLGRRLILLYESSEGGAGVLRHLIDDHDALAKVAAKSLEICHFTPTGEDLKRAPRATEDCVKACYDCLLSYSNQIDHQHLDRHSIRDLLLQLASASVGASSAPQDPADQMTTLRALCESGLEKQWLEFLEKHRLRLPTHAQRREPAVGSRPDFTYDLPGSHVAIYVDGPYHDFPDRAARDNALRERMEDLGWLVIRFHHAEEWLAVVARYPNVFGKPSVSTS
ncbi:MAG: DEAD/DEAH box helicase [Opitutaceae bacterium]|nr:DEAD/DEAH box helicase [Opitutaceae bacterium]